jgi:ABC-type transport system substrate-binding protein
MRRPAVVLPLLLVLWLGACTPGSDDPEPPDVVATPPSGGSVDLGVVGEPATLDPYGRDASDLTYALVRPVFPTPFRLLPDGNVEADLAASLDEVPGGARLELKEAQWSNGRPITARDVVASIERATPPSGFADIRSATAESRRTVMLRGDVDRWPETLASGAYVLPRGRLLRGRLSGGPFRFARYDQGRRLVYERNGAWDGSAPFLDRIAVSFVQSTELLIRLLDEGKLDAAAPPSSVNLDERLDELGLAHQEKRGWEALSLSFDPDDVTRNQWIATAREVDLRALLATFIRDDGRFTNTLYPGPKGSEGFWSHVAMPNFGPPLSQMTLAAPEGDELLASLQRAIQLDLERDGITVEVVTAPWSTHYGRWRDDSPASAALLRASGAPGMSGPPDDTSSFTLPLAHVETIVTWREEVHGIAVNPSLDGPLWNAAEWWKGPPI